MRSFLLKTALKNVFSKKNASILSMLGFCIAFLSIFYIYSYVSFELGYDSKPEKADRIYRISGEIVASENTMVHAKLGPLFGQGLKDEFPEIENFTRLSPFREDVLLELDEEKFNVKEAYRADHSVFEIFSLEFVFGDKHKALIAPDQIVINQSLSQKIFGNSNPVGKTLKHNNSVYTVTGVIKDSPENVHHRLNVLFSISDNNYNALSAINLSEAYWMPATYTFILLKPNSDIATVTENFEPFFNKYMAAFGEQINSTFNPIAIPLKDLHFSMHMNYDFPKGNKSYSYILALVALFIFLIALLNYGNLLIFQSITNSKEIGLMKIFGASKYNLFMQFLINALLFVSATVALALFAFLLSLPYSETITGIPANDLYSGNGLLTLSVILILVASLGATLIPFIYQISNQDAPIINWKTTSYTKTRGLQMGKLVVVIQFSLSIILIMASITIAKQLGFLIDSDMGFDKNNVVIVSLPKGQTSLSKGNAFKNSLNASPLISQTSISSHTPGDILGSIHFQLEKDGETVTKIVNSMSIDYDYISLMGMEIKKGRNFSPEHKADDQRSIIVNEAFLDYCGFNDEIVDTVFNNVKLLGVLKNACFNSLHTKADPLLFLLNNDSKGYINVKLKTSNTEEAISFIKESWVSFFPEVPFEYNFLDQKVAMLYENDAKKNILIQLFTLVSIIISSMGFLNLASNISKQRSKEIGIRKVNGATSSELLLMLNKDFIKLVGIAFVLATPLAWYAMNSWLQNFAYRISLSWWIFVLSGLIALLMALVTVSWQTHRAARKNPVEALRYE
ncbi:MAG: ABC transporter permease [Bacteroidales bacterium]|nr:ABC transporter permease [Bacteroidales bacterium]MCF8390912.1 ABC transporter permease [Bacteroidales bacterium]